MFALARFSEAFLLLRGSDAGLTPVLVPLVLVVMNVAYAIVSGPAGSLSDHVDRRMLLGGGLIALIIADLVLALVPTVAGVLAAAAIWGVHMGLTQSLLSAWIADSAPDRLRGTAFGVFNLATGLTLFLASLLAGALWSMIGPAATFLAGARLRRAGARGRASTSDGRERPAIGNLGPVMSDEQPSS